MTAIVAIEHGKLDDRVKVSKNAFAKEGSSLFLKLGEEMTLENLLYGLIAIWQRRRRPLPSMSGYGRRLCR